MTNDDLSRRLHDFARTTEASAAAAAPDLSTETRLVAGRARRRRALRTGAVGMVAAAVVGGGVLGAGAVDLTAAPQIAPASEDPADPEPTVAPEEPAEEEVEEEVRRGPLEEYLAGTATDSQAVQVAREQVVAGCMAEAGFTYVAYVDPGTSQVIVPLEDEPGSPEYAERYGYGLSVDAPQEEISYRDPTVDPNEEIVAGLSEGERTAYAEALHGNHDEEWDPDHDTDGALHGDATGPADWDDSDCIGRAHLEVPDAAEDFEAAFPELVAALAGAEGRVDAGPRGDALEAEWSACMAQAGHTGLASQPEAYNRAWDAVVEVDRRTLADLGIDAETIGEVDPRTISPARWEAIVDAREPLRAPEVELAVADAACVAEVRYREVLEEISWDLEQQLLDENRAEIDAWLAEQEG